MIMERAVITIKGRVQRTGYRDLISDLAENKGITGTVENLPDGKSLRIVAEAEKPVLDDFIELIRVPDDPFVKIKTLDFVFQNATGEFESFEIIYDDFQKEGFERIGEAVIYLKRLNAGQDKMLEKQDKMLEKQDKMLEKQDTTIDILKSVKADTSKILENTSQIPAMREDIASIRNDTREIATKLWDKYEELSKEIAEMKITLSRIEAKVFG